MMQEATKLLQSLIQVKKITKHKKLTKIHLLAEEGQ